MPSTVVRAIWSLLPSSFMDLRISALGLSEWTRWVILRGWTDAFGPPVRRDRGRDRVGAATATGWACRFRASSTGLRHLDSGADRLRKVVAPAEQESFAIARLGIDDVTARPERESTMACQ